MGAVKPFILPITIVSMVLFFKVIPGGVQAVSRAAVKDETSESALSPGVHAGIMPVKQLLDLLEPQLSSRSVEDVAAVIKSSLVPFDQKLLLLRTIVGDDAYGLTIDDRVQLILNIAEEYAQAGDKQRYGALFDIMAQQFDLIIKSYPVYIALQHGYTAVVRPFIEWARHTADQHPGLNNELDLRQLKHRALKRAALLDDLSAIQKLKELTGDFDQRTLTDIVWYVARTGNGVRLLPELVKLGARVDDLRDGKTPLIEAVMQRHESVVKQLLAVGAQPNKMGSPEIGTPLQQAFSRRFIQIEQVLREAGAREGV